MLDLVELQTTVSGRHPILASCQVTPRVLCDREEYSKLMPMQRLINVVGDNTLCVEISMVWTKG
jgi:hypothetical protein